MQVVMTPQSIKGLTFNLSHRIAVRSALRRPVNVCVSVCMCIEFTCIFKDNIR